MPKQLTKPNDYKSLLTKVAKELSDLESFVKRRTAEGYWKVGKYIDEHLLANKDRADYGATLFTSLAKDLKKDRSTLLRSVQFYRAYPIVAPGRQLSWGHYRSLITVKDTQERNKLEKEIIKNNWDTHQIREYLNTKRKLEEPKDDTKPIAQITSTRGKPNVFKVIQSKEEGLVLDLGFRLKCALPKELKGLKDGDFVQLLNTPQKVQASPNELFTYLARIDKIIDGDTLLVTFNLNLNFTISQKLRLRSIDCPEMDTDEGKKAKRFVETSLKGCNYIIVKTHKDQADKFDRYLADIFYLQSETDTTHIAQEGIYLNQELLNERLACLYS